MRSVYIWVHLRSVHVTSMHAPSFSLHAPMLSRKSPWRIPPPPWEVPHHGYATAAATTHGRSEIPHLVMPPPPLITKVASLALSVRRYFRPPLLPFFGKHGFQLGTQVFSGCCASTLILFVFHSYSVYSGIPTHVCPLNWSYRVPGRASRILM